jgi:hypothetical protein
LFFSIYLTFGFLGFNVFCMKFVDRFGEKYFLGSTSDKETLIKSLVAIDSSALSSASPALACYTSFVSLIESLPLTTSDREICTVAYADLFFINPAWFIIPTSTGGKYHGGINGLQNTCGGIYNHVFNMCQLASSVLKRYDEVLEELKLSGALLFDMPSKLLTAILLHDIGRMGFDNASVFSVAEHGELAVERLTALGFKSESDLLYCVGNHMYGWKAINFFNHAIAFGISVSLVLLCMLCECDYFS